MKLPQLKRPQLRRPAPATAISIVALVVAMGGTSYAAMKIQTQDIAKGAVTSNKIADNTVRSKDVKDDSIRRKDLRGDFSGPQGAPGPQGQPGPAGMDGMDGADGAGTRWLLVNRSGEIEAQSGGFTIVAAYPTLANTAPAGMPDNSLRANGNVYIDAGEDLADNGITSTVVLQNTVDQDGGGMAGRTLGSDANAEFSGEIAVSLCNTGAPAAPPSGPTNCAPPGAQNAESFVVSPRLSDGSVTTGTPGPGADNTRKAFYVIVTSEGAGPIIPIP